MNESTHERLNRELSRMRVRDIGFWGGWALLAAVVLIYGFFTLNHVTNVRYVEGIAGETMPLMTEEGSLIRTRVTVEGQIRDIRMPSQLVHPAKGDPICLRAGEHRFTGHTSYVSVSPTLCESPSATDQVD
jgi:hypothetical protein